MMEAESTIMIRNLDTNELVHITDIEKVQVSRPQSRSLDLPSNISITTSTKMLKSPFFKNAIVTNYYHYNDSPITAMTGNKYNLITGDINGQIVITTLDDGATSHVTTNNGPINSLQISNDEKAFLSASDRKFSVIEINGRITKTIDADMPLKSVKFAPNDNNLVITISDNSLHVWSLLESIIITKMSFISPPTSFDFSSDGKQIVIGCYNGFIYIYDTENWNYVAQFIAGPRGKENQAKPISSIRFGPDNTILVSCLDSRVRLYSENYTFVRKYMGHQLKSFGMCLEHRNGKIMLATEKGIYFWSLDPKSSFAQSGFNTYKDDESSSYQLISLGKTRTISACTLTNEYLFVGDADGSIFQISV